MDQCKSASSCICRNIPDVLIFPVECEALYNSSSVPVLFPAFSRLLTLLLDFLLLDFLLLAGPPSSSRTAFPPSARRTASWSCRTATSPSAARTTSSLRWAGTTPSSARRSTASCRRPKGRPPRSAKKGDDARCFPIGKHRGAREKRYSFGYAVFLILALMKLLWIFPGLQCPYSRCQFPGYGSCPSDRWQHGQQSSR